MNLPLLAVGGGAGWPLPPTRNALWLAPPPAALGSTAVDALDQLLNREELRRRKQLAEIANAPAPPPLGVLAHQTGRGGRAHGAGNASLEEGEEVLEDEEDEEDEDALEEEDGEEELLADGQYSETESAFEEEESMGSIDVTGDDLEDLP